MTDDEREVEAAVADEQERDPYFRRQREHDELIARHNAEHIPKVGGRPDPEDCEICRQLVNQVRRAREVHLEYTRDDAARIFLELFGLDFERCAELAGKLHDNGFTICIRTDSVVGIASRR